MTGACAGLYDELSIARGNASARCAKRLSVGPDSVNRLDRNARVQFRCERVAKCGFNPAWT